MGSDEPIQRVVLHDESVGSVLSADIMEETRGRLAPACLIYGAAFLLAYLVPRAVGIYPDGESRLLPDLTAGVAIAIALVVAGLAKHPRVPTRMIFVLALWVQPVFALGVSATDAWATVSRYAASGTPIMFTGISWVCVLIIVYPIFVPASLGRTALGGLLSASTFPLMVFVAFRMFPTASLEGSVWSAVGMISAPPFVSAVLAIIVSGAVRTLQNKLREARKVGAYVLTEKLGSGGMGEVWRAEHSLLTRPAAIKLIQGAALGLPNLDSAKTLQRFEREAQATALLRCPHTVEIYDFGVDRDGAFFYVMELLDGLDLQTLVHRYGPQPASRAVFLLRQVCESLEEAHSHGLVHRDIKPANIFCCRYGLELDFVKVLDFGLVTTSHPITEGGVPTSKETGFMGTPGYISPEAMSGSGTIAPSLDIYAVGCVAYWLLAGRTVFEEKNLVRLGFAHLEKAPVPPSEALGAAIPRDLEELVLECLAKSPDDRPANVRKLLERLAACDVPPWTESDQSLWWAEHRPAVERELDLEVDDTVAETDELGDTRYDVDE